MESFTLASLVELQENQQFVQHFQLLFIFCSLISWQQCMYSKMFHWLPCIIFNIWEQISSGLQQVVSQKQSTQRVLHSSAHFHQVFQQVLCGCFLAFDVHHSNSYQQVSNTNGESASYVVSTPPIYIETGYVVRPPVHVNATQLNQELSEKKLSLTTNFRRLTCLLPLTWQLCLLSFAL